MPIIENTLRLKTAVAEFDFAVDGGAVGAITIRAGDSLGNQIPAGSVVTGGYVEVDTALTAGASGTLSAGVEAAGDLVAATIVAGTPWSTTGRKSIVPVGSGATSVKTTVARSLSVTVAVAALTAGKFRVVIFYK